MSLQKTMSLFKMALFASTAISSQAAILFEGGTVISFNKTTQSLQVLRNASLLIENDRITGLGEGSLPSLPSNVTHIDATGRIIGPGYVDTHHHLWQTAFKTLASNTTMPDYLQKFSEFGPALTTFTPEDIYLGQLTGSLELLHSGTTTVLDHAHGSFSNSTTDASIQASSDSGLRTFYAHALHVLPNNYSWSSQMSKLHSLPSDPRFTQNPLMNLGLAYDGFYSASAANISALREFVTSQNLSVVTTHYMDGPWGWLNSPRKLEELGGWLDGSTPVVFGHASYLSKEDVRILRARDQRIATTPESEFHFGHTHPHVDLVLDRGSIGIDCHFTFSGSLVQQARMFLQSLRLQKYGEVLESGWRIPMNSPMEVGQAYHLITRAGGLALRREDLGVVNVGAKADLVIYKGDSPNLLGWRDPVAAVVLHSDVGDVEDVLVDGKFVKQGGKLLYPEWEDVKEKFLKSAGRIQEAWEKIEWPALPKTFNEGFAQYGLTAQIET